MYNLFPLPSPSYPVNNSVCPRAASLRAIRAQGIVFHAFPREAERYIFYLIGIHMEHMAKNRERRSASSEMFSGQARTRKLVRFPDKERHQLFLEPEGLHTNEVYVQYPVIFHTRTVCPRL